MTEKKKVIDRNLKNIIKTFTKVITASSYINDKGELVKRKYNSSEPSDINEKSEYPDIITETGYSEKIRRLDKIENPNALDHDYVRAKKKKSSTVKRCRCKK